MDKQKETDSLLPTQSSPFKGDKRGSRGPWMVADTIEYELLKENAKVNRNNMTEAESAFWLLAKKSGLGEKCRRQYIIGQYIVDFFFRKSMLIVEIDGGYHRPDPQVPLKEDDQSHKKKWTGDMLVDVANSRTLRESWSGSEQIEYDRIRQEWLEHMKYRIIRFTNEEVLCDVDNVIRKVKENLINI